MSRAVTLAGYTVIACALGLQQVAAWRARRSGRPRRALTFGELLAALTRSSLTRWPILAGWLWLGWHLFVRVSWR